MAPTIFTQVFTIMGLFKRNVKNGETVAVPLVYALLSSKETAQYEEVLRSVQRAAEEFGILIDAPQRVMCDFELAIINNAARNIFPNTSVSCCLFHLGQSIYRKIQEEGLQRAYRDPEDLDIKKASHMMLSLAFVPVDSVKNSFSKFKTNAPEDLKPVVSYFDETYVNGKRAKGRSSATPGAFVELLNVNPCWLPPHEQCQRGLT